MADKKVLMRKKRNTGMHVAFLSAGSTVNGELFAKKGRAVLRPGNTVLCDPSELGEYGATQFELVGGGAVEVANAENIKNTPPQTSPFIQKRGNSGFYDVINPANPDTPLNVKALRKKEAEAFLADITGTEVVDDADDLDDMDWNDLVGEMDSLGIEMEDDFETEDHLRQAIREKRAEAE